MKTKLFTILLALIATNLFAQFPTNGIIVQYGFDNNINDGVNGSTPRHWGTNQTFINDRFGNANSAINFGGDRYDTTDINYGTNDEADTTISFWIKTNTNSTDEKIIMNRLAGVGYRINLVEGQIKVLARYEYTFYNGLKRTEGHDAISNAKINDNEWHLVTIQIWKRSDNLGTSKGVDYFTRIYIDNVLDNTVKRNRRPNTFLNRQLNVTRGHTTNQTTGIVKFSNTINEYQDNLDDLLVYNRLLTSTEISNIANYNSFCIPVSTSSLTVSNVTATNITLTNNNSGAIDAQYYVNSSPANAITVTNIQPNTSFNIDANSFSGDPESYGIITRKNCAANGSSSWSQALTVKNTGVPTYVNTNATGTNNGSSWANAYTDLQTALANALSGEEIWIATGTYHPHASSRTTYYVIDKTDLKIYGGFDGTESELNDRIIGSNETILSGDLQDDDVNTTDFVSNYSNTTRNADNSHHVVNITATGNNLLLDGITISDAHNNLNATEGGAAIVKEKTVNTLTIKNCIIKDNVSRNGNAGLVAEFDLSINNTVGQGELIIENCQFTNNMSRWASGIYSFLRNKTEVDIKISNSLFDRNIAANLNTGNEKGLSGSAGWLRNIGDALSELNIEITNTTFVNNIATGTNNSLNNFDRATLALSKNNISGNTTATVSNSIFWDNTTLNGATARSITDQYAQTLPINSLTIINSIDEANFTDDSITNKTNTSNTDPLFTDAANEDYTLSTGSPAIDTGNNTKVIGLADLLGNQRIYNTTVDMGPYEFGAPVATLSNDTVLSKTDKLTVYPNPVSDVLRVSENVKNLKLYSINGQLIAQTTMQQLNVSELSAGVYFAKITTLNGSIITKKVIKK